MNKLVKIKNLCLVIAGQSPDGSSYNDRGEGLPFYQGKKEFGSKYIGSPKVWTKNITKTALKDDILMSVRAPVGPVNFCNEKICIGRGLAAIRVGQDLDKDYLFYFLLSQEGKISGNVGAVFPSISKSQIEEISIPYIDIVEQRKIVNKIIDIFSKIDQIKINNEKALKDSYELFSSYSNSILINSKESKKVALTDITENLDSRRIPITKNVRKSGKFPYYGATGIVDYVDDYIFDERLILIGEDGAKWGAGERSAFIVEGKYWVNNHAHVIRTNEREVIDEWLVYVLNLSDLRRYVTGLTVPKLNQGKLKEIPIILPSINEQKIMVEKLEDLSDMTNKMALIFGQKFALLEELKKSILHKAFFGEL